MFLSLFVRPLVSLSVSLSVSQFVRLSACLSMLGRNVKKLGMDFHEFLWSDFGGGPSQRLEIISPHY